MNPPDLVTLFFTPSLGEHDNPKWPPRPSDLYQNIFIYCIAETARIEIIKDEPFGPVWVGMLVVGLHVSTAV